MTNLPPIYLSEKVFNDDCRHTFAMDLHSMRTYKNVHFDDVATQTGLNPRTIDEMERGIFECVDNQYNIRPLLVLLEFYQEPIELNFAVCR